MTPSKVFRVNGVRVGVIGAALEETPELVSAGATRGLAFLDEARRVAAESRRLARAASRSRSSSSTRGRPRGSNAVGNTPAVPWDGPILQIADRLKPTTVDAMVVGHTHRISNLMRGHILVTEGINAGTSYSVLQLMVSAGRRGLGGRRHPRRQDAGGSPRADVQAIIDAANAETAELRNQVIGTRPTTSCATPPG